MTTSIRTPLVAALAACLSLTAVATGCNEDEPATYLPESGEWTYLRTSLVSDTCSDPTLVPGAFATFFWTTTRATASRFELGDNDVVCEIRRGRLRLLGLRRGERSCPWLRRQDSMVAHLVGEFASESEATGHEVIRVACLGDDCNLIKTVPCVYDSKFEAAAIRIASPPSFMLGLAA